MLGASNRIRPCAKDVGSTAVTRSLRLVSSNIFGPGLMTLSENRMPQRFDGFLSFSIFAHQACYSGYPTCPHVVFSWDRLNVCFNEFKRVGPQTCGRGLSQRFEMTWWSSQDSLGIPGSRQDRWKMWLGESRNGKRIARWALYMGWPRLLTASWCPWWFCSHLK